MIFVVSNRREKELNIFYLFIIRMIMYSSKSAASQLKAQENEQINKINSYTNLKGILFFKLKHKF